MLERVLFSLPSRPPRAVGVSSLVSEHVGCVLSAQHEEVTLLSLHQSALAILRAAAASPIRGLSK